jgi:hypothetical protein
MSDGYYKIAANKSDADEAIYQHGALVESIMKFAPDRKDNVPVINDIRVTHRFPLKPAFIPVILMANQMKYITTNTNTFITDYGGEVQAQIFMRWDFTEMELSALDATEEGFAFSLCPNFVCAVLDYIAFRVGGDIVTRFSGNALFAYTSLFIGEDHRPALGRMWKEVVPEFVYLAGGPANVAGAVTYPYEITSFEVRFTHKPLQAPDYQRDAFSLWVPLDPINVARSMSDCYPLASVHNLERKIEYSIKTVEDYTNVCLTSIGSSEFVEPFSAFVNWLHRPAQPTVSLYVNYILVHRDLQKTLALSPWAKIIRQYEDDSFTVTGATHKELSYTKIVEWIAIIARYTRNTVRTLTGATLADGGANNNNIVYMIDPFYLPPDTAPIDEIRLLARGNVFYDTITWEIISDVFPFMFKGDHSATTKNGCLAVIPITQELSNMDLYSTYNSGYGPNLDIEWRQTVFDTTDTGSLVAIVCAINVLATYRGVLSIRYT